MVGKGGRKRGGEGRGGRGGGGQGRGGADRNVSTAKLSHNVPVGKYMENLHVNLFWGAKSYHTTCSLLNI